ncbi:MAG TPA: peptidylprolyl isomerase [Synergistaceae bacterium]|jgi:peptidylprolyl isomerase|nr:peptidylprolyl isomerase [Synergistaceae bacterium]HQH78124.1 peptidylprolyl isomerase [Synergistaceae bacterium]HQK24139.1 peptidylprolyl isomerase [Synergistaceae bacterium]
MHATKGSVVKVHYRGTLRDGSVFDSSQGREPLEFVVGAGQMIAGFDQGVEGMALGEERTLVIPPERAYGPWNEDLVMSVPRTNLPEGYDPAEGDQLHMALGPRGRPFPVTVMAVEEDHVVLDGNHRLAGEELTFAVTLVALSGSPEVS